MKKLIKPNSNGVYALLGLGEYLVYNSEGFQIGLIRAGCDLIIISTLASQTQLSRSDLKNILDILMECEVEFELAELWSKIELI